MTTRKTFTKTDPLTKFTTTSEAFTTDGGLTWKWASNNAVIEVQICQEYGIPCHPLLQQAARDAYLDEAIAKHRAAWANHTPGPEEQYEMRAAFGSGKTVVDVITGKRYQT